MLHLQVGQLYEAWLGACSIYQRVGRDVVQAFVVDYIHYEPLVMAVGCKLFAAVDAFFGQRSFVNSELFVAMVDKHFRLSSNFSDIQSDFFQHGVLTHR